MNQTSTTIRALELAREKHGLEYVKLDSNLSIIEMSEGISSLACSAQLAEPGAAAVDVFWELVGLETVLEQVMSGDLAKFELPSVNRGDGYLTCCYFSYEFYPLDPATPSAGILMLVEDTTEIGFMEQRLTQQRNDLSIVRRQLEKTVSDLEMANRDLDMFGYAVAHDLRNPLSQIVGYSSMLADPNTSGLDGEVAWMAQQVESAAHRMGMIIESLLMLSHMRTIGDKAMQVEMPDVINRAYERVKNVAQRRGVSVTITPDLPAVIGYAPWLELVFINLLINAIKYIGRDNDAPTIRIRAATRGDLVRYEVTDNGMGISEADQESIFQLFKRAHLGVAKGYGIGLSIVSQVVRKMNGTVGVDSRLGEGSTFWFVLPAALPADPDYEGIS